VFIKVCKVVNTSVSVSEFSFYADVNPVSRKNISVSRTIHW